MSRDLEAALAPRAYHHTDHRERRLHSQNARKNRRPVKNREHSIEDRDPIESFAHDPPVVPSGRGEVQDHLGAVPNSEDEQRRHV